MKRLIAWLDDRTGVRAIVHEALYERVPGGARWRYVWGSTLVFAFVVQLVTGFFLWTAYSPNAQGAYESVYYIQHEMQGGWLLRGIHHFMAQAMVVLLVLHLVQVVIDGAYRAPREINFWVGLVLMLIVLGLSLTGYLLPWDQKGFWATKVATNIMGITPAIGPEMQRVVVGGADYGHHTLTRFFALHAGLLPFLLIACLGLHLYVFRRHGITPYRRDAARDTTFWPDQVLRDSVACLAVLAAVLFLTIGLPAMNGKAFGPEMGAHLGPPADPTDQYNAARPEWYFLFLFQFLKYFPGETEVIGAIVIPGVVVLFLFLMPLIGRWKAGHVFNVLFLGGLLLGVGWLTFDAVRDDRDDTGYIAAVDDAERAARRVPELVEAYGIRTDGAVQLVRDDPFLQGPALFARNCASCHRWDGLDGAGRKPAEQPTAADLANFGSRAWSRSVLLEYSSHFSAWKNARWYQDRKAALEQGGGVEGELLDPDEGEMATWSSDNREALGEPGNQKPLDALIEFLVAQSARTDLSPPDEQLAEQGRELFQTYEWPGGELPGTTACSDCHAMHARGDDEPLSEGAGDGYPILTGYGGGAWLREFISDPARHYGEKNQMPAYQGRLSERDLDLLVRWMTGDYYPTQVVPHSTPADSPAASDTTNK